MMTKGKLILMHQYLLLQGLRAGLVEARSLPWPITFLEGCVCSFREATSLATTTDPDRSEVHVGWSTLCVYQLMVKEEDYQLRVSKSLKGQMLLMSVMIVNVLSDLGVNDQRRSSITIYCYFNH
jgi:hypothetical protein